MTLRININLFQVAILFSFKIKRMLTVSRKRMEKQQTTFENSIIAIITIK
jgi:hypothetical protein